MKLRVLGSSGGCPARGNPASGYLVTQGDTTVWLDAGSGTFQRLADHIDPGTVDAVVISHIHADHCIDLFGFFGYMAYGPSGRVPVPVFVPEGAAAHLGAFMRAGEDHLWNVILDIATVDEGDEVEVGSLGLRFARTHHPVPTIATRVEGPGGTLAYSADTGPGGGFPALTAGADVVLCEATIQGERSAQTYAYHLTAAEAGALASEAGARDLILTHLSPTLDPAVSMAEAATTWGRPPTMATPGAVFEV